jgi:hypothetical protein
MNKKYINMMLLKLSEKHQYTLINTTTYKRGKKYNGYKLVIYDYLKDDKVYKETLEFKNEIELLIYLKELI